MDVLFPIACVGSMVVFLIFALITYPRFIRDSAYSADYHPFKHYYSVPLNTDGIYQALSVPMIYGMYKTEFFPEERTLQIKLSTGTGGVIKLLLSVTEAENFSVLTVSPLSPQHMRLATDPFDLDGYLARKLDATPIPQSAMRPHT